MLSKLIKILKNISAVLFDGKISFTKIDGSSKRYPKVLQLPITKMCNSKCVMCNVWKDTQKSKISKEKFASYLADKIFKEIEIVGVNGGEPSLVDNLLELIEEILKLPKLKSLNIITNGFKKDKFLMVLEQIYIKCKQKKIKFHISVSLDGVENIHDKVRGIENIFQNTIYTIDTINDNKNKYCDSFDVGCTIIKQNIEYLPQLETYIKNKNKNIDIDYRIGVGISRINNLSSIDEYSVLEHKYNQLLKDFFFSKARSMTSFYEKFKYFSIFYSLENKNSKRLLGCDWKDNGITLDIDGNIYYCAVKSKSLGNLAQIEGKEIFFSDENISHRKNIIKNDCDSCIHDYTGRYEWSNLLVYLKFIYIEKLSMKFYRVKARLL